MPVNMPLSQAFPRKNWKAQILLSAKIRVKIKTEIQNRRIKADASIRIHCL